MQHKSLYKLTGIVLLLVGLCFSSCQNKATKDMPKKPNIILIMADDMGYSDIGCYGGEIETPNLDKLADNGVRFTQFYNSARCCPTRASLLTGLYPHQSGMGWMTSFSYGQPGYTGEINNNCLTIAEVLKTAGYKNYLSGKWHLTHYDNVKPNSCNGSWPIQRGFDKFYGTLRGSGSFFKPSTLTDGNTQIEAPDSAYYYTDAITDHAVSYIKSHREEHAEEPFFMYVAYTAPHYPLHAKPEDIGKYKGKYMEGWEKLREQRLARLKELGIMPANTVLPPLSDKSYHWDTLSDEKKTDMDLRMAIYAAMVDNMDQGIGKIVEELKAQKQFDNTIIMFLSDNGASSEFRSKKDKSLEAMGSEASFESYTAAWANASNTPYRLFKSWIHEGGVATPFIIHWGNKQFNKGSLIKQPAHITDVMATCVAVSGAKYPTSYKQHAIAPMVGSNLIPFAAGLQASHAPIFWEHEANLGVRDGQWKLVSKSNKQEPYMGKLELYNVDEDRNELNDLSDTHPEKVKELYNLWLQWAEDNNVLPLDGRVYIDKLKHYVQ